MNPIARVSGFTFSVLIHVALGVAIIALSSAHWTRPLFVDLLERPEPVGPAAAPPAPAARRPVVPPSPGPASPRAAASARREVPAPVEPARVAEPTPPVAPPAPVSPVVPEPVAPPPGVAAQPIEPAPPAVSAASAPVAPVAPPRSGAAESTAGALASSPTRDDAGPAIPATGGTTLARATPGSGPGPIPAEYGPYLRGFRRRVQEALVYPLAARRRGLGGTVELEVLLESSGRVRDVRVVRSSAHDVLDDAALETIRRLGPTPFPETLPRRPLLIRIPLVFEIR